jgi:hypothetical protein
VTDELEDTPVQWWLVAVLSGIAGAFIGFAIMLLVT